MTWARCVLGSLAVFTLFATLLPASPQPAILRFHHAHYRVADPAAAMAEAARALSGVRVILPGLGVGVRVDREFLLFERAEGPAAPPLVPARTAYAAAAARLSAWGTVVDPATPDRIRVLSVLSDLPLLHLAFAADDFAAAVDRVSAAGARITSRTEDAASIDAGGGVVIEIVRDTDREETFWCPMHPDVRSAETGKCPVCGMELVAIPPPRLGEYKLDVTQIRDRRRGVMGLSLGVREPGTNAPVLRFATVHEKLFHLFIVGRDLEYFAHVHPDRAPDGTFTLAHPFPPGEYMLIADFLPEGGTAQMVQKTMFVTGKTMPAGATINPRGLEVRLRTEDLAAGKHARLTFTVHDVVTGGPVTDLEPYLGAPAHMLLVRADLGDAIHAHPEELATGGPTVSFHPVIPAPGAYRLWIQFQRRGEVSTTAFDLNVEK